jgi:hypothetical protein
MVELQDKDSLVDIDPGQIQAAGTMEFSIW